MNTERHNRSILCTRYSKNRAMEKVKNILPYSSHKDNPKDYNIGKLFKPRIIKRRNCDNSLTKINDKKFSLTVCSTNDIKKLYDKKIKTSSVPKINRHKKDIDQYINKSTIIKFTRPERTKRIIKRNNSLDLKCYTYTQKKKDECQDNNFDKISVSKESCTSYLCKNCFDKKLLEYETKDKNFQINKKEYLNDKFVNESPFYLVDEMGEIERNRIFDKVEQRSNKQRLALLNYKDEMNDPKNNKVEKLQLINEYSVNPLTIEIGKDPRYLKQRKYYEEKEKMIHENPDKYKSLGMRKAYKDYYNKCIYQVPKMETSYYMNHIYKNNYIKDLKRQIEEKKMKENEKKKKQKMAEAFANKKLEKIGQLEKDKEIMRCKNDIKKFQNDNEQLDNYKKYKKYQRIEKEKILENELDIKNIKVDSNLKLRDKIQKVDNIEIYKDWIGEFEKKSKIKKDIRDEENKKWINYINNYKIKSQQLGTNCDECNRPYRKEYMRKFPYSFNTDEENNDI